MFLSKTLEVAAGIREPIERFVAGHRGIRIAEPRFTEIRQALEARGAAATTPSPTYGRSSRSSKRTDSSLRPQRRDGREDATVAPPAD